MIEAIAHAGEEEYARALHRRYTDFWLVDREIELALAELQKPVSRAKDEEAHSGLKLIAGGRL